MKKKKQKTNPTSSLRDATLNFSLGVLQPSHLVTMKGRGSAVLAEAALEAAFM